ncbi:hypothetical protein NMY22_g10750 [Coprinellus aureogranulatus]|nr:hypothetical protein NMY22_g10750 [Coprinellus aureogranulatus]
MVTQPIFQDHKDRRENRLEAEIAGLAILDAPSTPSSGTPSPAQGRTSRAQRTPSRRMGNKDSGRTQGEVPAGQQANAKVSSAASPKGAPIPSSRLPMHENGGGVKEDPRALEIYSELRNMEIENDRRYEMLKSGPMTQLSAPFDPSRAASPAGRRQSLEQVRDERTWMVERLHRIQTYSGKLDEANAVFANAIVEILNARIKELTRITNPPSLRDPSTPVYDNSRYFSEPIHELTPAALIILMMAVVLNLLARVTRGPCNFVLRMSKLAVHAATNNLSAESDIPDDIRTARKHFKLDPVVTVYAVCSCGKLHAPTSSHPFPVYPAATCECGARLTKATGHHNGIAIRKPLRPYTMQDFTDFRGRVYSQPGNEALMRRENYFLSRSDEGFVSDIKDARAYRDLKGPDGRPFIDCPTEIRSIWSLSYDGYNPGSNKAAGKTASVGCLAMSCLSLPPSLRNRPENLYLAGLIPGPRQPSGDGLNPFLSPLVDVLHSAYHTGTFFSQTYEHPEGITSREALLPVIADLPAARKVVGGAGHSASVFCMYCHVLLADINNIDMSTPAWRPKTGAEFREAAEEWRNASSKENRKKLYKKNGVRWSELLRLDYWDPVQNTVIDGMHNLLLGVVRHHFREVIGTHWDVKAADVVPENPPKEKDLILGRRLLDTGDATWPRLKRLTRPALSQLCRERGVHPAAVPGKKIHKKQLAVALLETSKGSPSVVEEASDIRIHHLEDTTVPDIFSIDLGEGSARPVRREMLDTDELKAIQQDIKKTLRPSNQTSPPRDFGSPSHGKLKADEWRACIEFDLPISMAKLWADGLPEDNVNRERYALALESTFLLAMALRYATSHRTCASHRGKYLTYMNKYLQSILELHPGDTLHPNHHNALHLPVFLELFGPIQGWWMFPFERLIGILQRHMTNFKFGELEETVIKTFCSAAHLKKLLDQPQTSSSPESPPTVLEQCFDIIQRSLPDSVKGTMLETSRDRTETSRPVPKLLDKDIVEVFGLADLTGVQVNVFSRVQQGRSVFATRNASRANSTVFFLPPGQSQVSLCPGAIREIFEYGGANYLVVQPYKQKHASFFDRFSDFGAEVWSRELHSQPSVIPVSSSVHGCLLREWESDKLVLKPIIHVRPDPFVWDAFDQELDDFPTELLILPASRETMTGCCPSDQPATRRGGLQDVSAQ